MDYVRVTDVSPRDGLQNEQGIIPTQDKVRLIELLCETGVDEVEVTSFVSPKWVPQLGDAEQVCIEVSKWKSQPRKTRPNMHFSALVPNAKGFESAVKAWELSGPRPAIDTISLFTAASEEFCKRNTNATIAESLERFEDIYYRIMHSRPVFSVRVYVSCVIACPFAGPIAPEQVANVVAKICESPFVEDIDLGDTIGAGTPHTTKEMLRAVMPRIPKGKTATLHLHDTFGTAASCVKTALDLGIRSFDGSVAGIGGCPYASTPGKRAPGNISTELLVRTIHAAGYKTNVDLDKLELAATFARDIVAKSRASF